MQAECVAIPRVERVESECAMEVRIERGDREGAAGAALSEAADLGEKDRFIAKVSRTKKTCEYDSQRFHWIALSVRMPNKG